MNFDTIKFTNASCLKKLIILRCIIIINVERGLIRKGGELNTRLMDKLFWTNFVCSSSFLFIMFCAYVQKEGIEQLVSGNLWDVEPVGIQDHGTCSKFLRVLIIQKFQRNETLLLCRLGNAQLQFGF